MIDVSESETWREEGDGICVFCLFKIMWHNWTHETQPWNWYYLADCGSWHRFEDEPDHSISSEDMEQYYQRTSPGTFEPHSTFTCCRTKMDFSAMLQTDLDTGRQRRIQRSHSIERRCSCFSAAPIFWDPVDPTSPYQLFPLSELTPEYRTVAGYVKTEGRLNNSIVSISRIQNLDLWEIYCKQRKLLTKIHGIKDIEVKRLFHGTEIKNVDAICKYNFDVRLAGKHAHVFGHGVYFAKYASYADKHSPFSTDPLPGGTAQSKNRRPTKILFLALVMVGKSIVGKSHFRKPDHGSVENKHNSCVDDIKKTQVFVIFNPNQIYPEYLIQYT